VTSSATSAITRLTRQCAGGSTGGGGSSGSTAPSPVQETVSTPTVSAPVVSAQEILIKDAVSKIQALQAQIQALQSARNQNIPTPPSYSFTSGFGPGSRGEQVRQLQIYLNTHGFPVSSSGLGSLGNETSFFGPATSRALMLFQKSFGLDPVPWVGPATRAALNK
jgi:murein L,D-transpeptidase YcbB/YkuD